MASTVAIRLCKYIYPNNTAQGPTKLVLKSLPEVLTLVMQVVPAQYAFVVHTANPISKQKGTTFGEVVMGMGEALVGNYPGRALSFSSAPGQKASLAVVTEHWAMVLIFAVSCRQARLFVVVGPVLLLVRL